MISAEAFLQNSGPLRPAYLLHGEEPFHQRAVRDRVMALAQSAGIRARHVWEGETAQADWAALDRLLRTADLFGGGQVVEVRLPKGQPGREGSEWIRQWCQAPAQDGVALIVCGRLETRQLKSAWAQAVEQAGVVIQARPIPPEQLPQWLRRQADARGLRLSQEAVALLAERGEGNLLALDQALEILALRYGDGASVDVPEVIATVADQAHYDLFALSDALLAGEAEQALHVLRRLRQEGTEAPLILWLLAREIRLLYSLSLQPEQAAQLFRRHRVWARRQSVYRQAARRLEAEAWQALLAQLHRIDLQSKGQLAGSAWREMEHAIMTFAMGRSLNAG